MAEKLRSFARGEDEAPELASPAAASPSWLPAVLASLRHRNFRLFISGQMISLIGTWMQSIAQSWLVYRLTHSSALLGLVVFAGQIPVLLLATIGGTVADRRSRHRIVIATQITSMVLAFILAGLTLSGLIQVWQIFALSIALGIVNAFDIPARQSFIVQMVGRDDLTNAIALNSSVFNGARIVGPAIAGILVAAIGEGWCFFANGASYIAVIIGLLLMDIRPVRRLKPASSALAHVAEGFHFVWKSRPIRALLLLLGVTSLTAMPFTVLMPIFADQILHGGARGLGILMGLSGVGALTGALFLAARPSLRGLGRVIAGSSLGFGTSLILFGISKVFWLSGLLLVGVGFFMLSQMASSNSLIQAMSPDHLRGRVMAVYSMMFMGMAPFGALFAGFLAQRIGAPLTVAIGGASCAVASLVFGSRLSSLRAEARKLISGQMFETP